MLTRRWLIVLPSVIAVAALGLGTWQVLITRSQRDAARQQLTAASAQLSELRALDGQRLSAAKQKIVQDQRLITAANQALDSLGAKYDQATTTTTTTTTIPPSTGLSVSLTRSSGQLTTGVGFTLTATVWRTSSPSDIINGAVTFDSDGSPLSFCTKVALSLSFPGPSNVATCSLDFTQPGTYNLSASSSAANGQTGYGALTVSVSS